LGSDCHASPGRRGIFLALIRRDQWEYCHCRQNGYCPQVHSIFLKFGTASECDRG